MKSTQRNILRALLPVLYWLPLFLTLFSCLSFLSSCTSPTVYKSLWQPEPIQADGYTGEWLHPFIYYDPDSKLYFSVNNDLNNFYFCIKSMDPGQQIKILQSGLQLWIDTTGNHHEITGIQFPFSGGKPRKKNPQGQNQPGQYSTTDSSQMGGGGQMQGPPRQPTLNSARDKFIHSEKLMHLSGFRPPVGGIVPVPNDHGITAYINWDSLNTNTMIYELVIPFSTFYKNQLSPRDSSKIVGLTVTINGTTGMPGQGPGGMRPGGFSVGMGMGMGMGMGGMGMGMGGMGMGMGGMGMGMGAPMGRYNNGGYGEPAVTFKTRFKLAVLPPKGMNSLGSPK